MESCYHPVLEIQWSCENPPTDFLKAFVILQILLRKFYSEHRIFLFQTTCFIFLPLALSFFDKVGSLFFSHLSFSPQVPILLLLLLQFLIRYVTFTCLANLERITFYPAYYSAYRRHCLSVVLAFSHSFHVAAFCLQPRCALGPLRSATVTPIPCPMA